MAVGTRLRAAVVLVLAAWAGGAASRRCCPGEAVLVAATKRCANTTAGVGAGAGAATRPINCTHGMYKIDPNLGEEHFLITESKSLQLGNSYIEDGQFCVTHVQSANGSVTQQEVAFVCFSAEEGDEDTAGEARRATSHTVLGVCIFVSTVFLAATLAAYGAVPDIRDLEGKCLMGAVLALLVSFLVLGTLQFHGDRLERKPCVAFAFFMYYWMIASFFWLNIVSFNLWRSVVRPSCGRSWSEGRLLAGYCVYGWGGPVALLAAALATHHLPGDTPGLVRPGFGDVSCWFGKGVETWAYFYGPIAVILALNTGFFVSTSWSLWKSYNSHEPKLHSLRYKCVLYAKLFIIMGIAWIFELVSHLHDPQGETYFWYATDIFNSLQGVLIFVITVACRRRVVRALTRHRPCGLTLPKQWAAGVDEESDAVLTEDVVEMSPTQPAPADADAT